MTTSSAWRMVWVALIVGGWAGEVLGQPRPLAAVNCGGYALIPPGELELIEPRYHLEGIMSVEPTSELGLHARIPRSLLVKRTEVTQAEWAAVMGSNPSYFQSCGLDCPVELVSWYDAVYFVNRLSRLEGLDPCYELVGCEGAPGSGSGETLYHSTLGTEAFVCREVYLISEACTGYRLPTDAEWEYAYRAGGPSTDYYNGDRTVSEWYEHDPALDSIAWYLHNSDHPTEPGETTWPVARKLPNAWGLFDMSGNVVEWAFDGVPGVGARRHPDPPDFKRLLDMMWRRSLRGCGFEHDAIACEYSRRIYISSGERNFSIGLRPVRTMSVHMCPQSLPPLVPSSLPEQHF